MIDGHWECLKSMGSKVIFFADVSWMYCMVPKVRQNVVVVMSRTDVVAATWTLTSIAAGYL
ncbi:hypothetical protein ESP60_00115 [Anaplasma phagocytophilum]|nr:hypothetical protein ESP60_00115 [Anaplasma phagocytophilum]